MLLDVTRVAVQPDFTLLLEFENGERRSFDMACYLDQKPWARLKTCNAFMGAFVENGTVVWPGNIDIDPETLYERSVPFSDQKPAE
ncbi:DUF2442 domain-containing protein [Propionivibrio sp.]|uniref:DUF2442 domain-containing protein n=1 Tax=Propionivibrio sp. TaxID=2212460 RepID=UPI003BF3FB7F